MDESFLHFVWKYQRFEIKNLQTTDGEQIIVFHPGHHNHDSGPDFEEGRIKIGEIEWIGSIEIHIQSSDWNRHFHSENKAYKNVILHVVWNNDKELTVNQEKIPTLELKRLVDPAFVSDYKNHINIKDVIACSSQFSRKLDMAYIMMIDRVLVERLKQKADDVLKLLEQTTSSWDEIFYKTLVTNFGFSINKVAFQQLSEKVPYGVLKKNLSSITKVLALFFGQAGFLEIPEDDYQLQLKNEFDFLKSKYELPHGLKKHEWKFGRMRPSNFPSLRLAQISSLLHSKPRIFTDLLKVVNTKEAKELFKFDLHSYWKDHYDFRKRRMPPKNPIGQSTLENLFINSVAPVLAGYAKYVDNQIYMDRAVELLESINAEKNKITKDWKFLGKEPKTAFDSQAQIQLFNEYCKKRKCLSCSVGVSLLDR